MLILLENKLLLILLSLALFVLVGCCDKNFSVEKNVRIIDQGVNAEYRYKVFLNSTRCGSGHGISFTTYEYKDRDSIEFHQRTGNFDPDGFRLTRFVPLVPVKEMEVSTASVTPKKMLKGSIQIEENSIRINLQYDRSFSYGNDIPVRYKPYGYNGVYKIIE